MCVNVRGCACGVSELRKQCIIKLGCVLLHCFMHSALSLTDHIGIQRISNTFIIIVIIIVVVVVVAVVVEYYRANTLHSRVYEFVSIRACKWSCVYDNYIG